MSISSNSKKITTILPEDLWIEVKVAALRRKVSIQDLLLEIVEKAMSKKKHKDVIEET